MTEQFLKLADEAFRVEPSFKKDFNNHYVRDLAQAIRTLCAMLDKCRKQRDSWAFNYDFMAHEEVESNDAELQAIADGKP